MRRTPRERLWCGAAAACRDLTLLDHLVLIDATWESGDGAEDRAEELLESLGLLGNRLVARKEAGRRSWSPATTRISPPGRPHRRGHPRGVAHDPRSELAAPRVRPDLRHGGARLARPAPDRRRRSGRTAPRRRLRYALVQAATPGTPSIIALVGLVAAYLGPMDREADAGAVAKPEDGRPSPVPPLPQRCAVIVVPPALVVFSATTALPEPVLDALTAGVELGREHTVRVEDGGLGIASWERAAGSMAGDRSRRRRLLRVSPVDHDQRRLTVAEPDGSIVLPRADRRRAPG